MGVIVRNDCGGCRSIITQVHRTKSALSVVQRMCRRVRGRHHEDQVERWVDLGRWEAEPQVRRVKDYQEIPLSARFCGSVASSKVTGKLAQAG